MKQTDLRSALPKKGFSQRQSHHKFFHYETLDGQTTSIFTKLSHGARGQLSSDLVADIARQLKVSKRELEEFVDCSLSQADYERKLREAGHIPRY